MCEAAAKLENFVNYSSSIKLVCNFHLWLSLAQVHCSQISKHSNKFCCIVAGWVLVDWVIYCIELVHKLTINYARLNTLLKSSSEWNINEGTWAISIASILSCKIRSLQDRHAVLAYELSTTSAVHYEPTVRHSESVIRTLPKSKQQSACFHGSLHHRTRIIYTINYDTCQSRVPCVHVHCLCNNAFQRQM